MTRINLTFDADLNDERNTYTGLVITNIGQAIALGCVPHGTDVHVELGTGDVVQGSLVSVAVNQEDHR